MTPDALKAVAATGGVGFSGWLAWLTTDLPLAVFGVPFAFLLAGFAGSLLALGVSQPLPRWKMVVAVLSGTLAAAWLVLPATELLGLTKPYPGYAFVLGLVAHSVITLVVSKGPAWVERLIEGRYLGGQK